MSAAPHTQASSPVGRLAAARPRRAAAAVIAAAALAVTTVAATATAGAGADRPVAAPPHSAALAAVESAPTSTPTPTPTPTPAELPSWAAKAHSVAANSAAKHGVRPKDATKATAASVERASRSAERAAIDPVALMTKPLAKAAGTPKLFPSCGYNPRIQQMPALDAEQMANARTIIGVGQVLGLPPRAAVIALATAYQESWIRNLSWGDRDSLGLFQQRPSFGWGTAAQLQTPAFAAAAFYGPLASVPGWDRMPVTVAAQTVQRSAFPDKYAQWELMAATLVNRILEVPDKQLNCTRR